MNEKLEQQLNDYYYRNYAYITSQADTKEIVKSIAQHFYNLALADVRGMVTRQQKANHTGTDEWIRAKAIAYESICDFIDNLTK